MIGEKNPNFDFNENKILQILKNSFPKELSIIEIKEEMQNSQNISLNKTKIAYYLKNMSKKCKCIQESFTTNLMQGLRNSDSNNESSTIKFRLSQVYVDQISRPQRTANNEKIRANKANGANKANSAKTTNYMVKRNVAHAVITN